MCAHSHLRFHTLRSTCSRAIWSFWDRTKIAETNAFFGWWDMDDTPAVVAEVHMMSEGNCTWQITRGEYYGLGNTDWYKSFVVAAQTC